MSITGGWLPNSVEDVAERRFELKGALLPGESASAYLIVYSTATSRWQHAMRDGVEVEFTVKAWLSSFEGDGEDEQYYGERGYAKFHRDSQQWEIWQLDCERALKEVEA